MDFALVISHSGQPNMSLEPVRDMRNNILLSLHVMQGSFFLNPDFGSRLHEIRSLTENELALAQTYAYEALEWLVKIGRAQRINTAASRSSSQLKITVEAITSDASPVIYETYFRVV